MLLFCISAFWWKESWFNFLPTTAQSFDLSGVQGLKKVDLKLYSTLLKYFNKSNNSKTSWIHIRVGWGGGWGWGGLQQSESFLQNCQESCQYKPKRCTHPPKNGRKPLGHSPWVFDLYTSMHDVLLLNKQHS
jgi:hypothetical protein